MSVTWTKLHPSEMFWRQLRFAEFDVSELSLSSLLIGIDRGDDRWVAIPVFTTREFFHTWILVRSDAGIDEPSDLVGKRVGVPEYQQTAALWARGALEHEFAVTSADVEWFMERPPRLSHGGATGFAPPDGVRLSYLGADTNIGAAMLSGDLDATLLYLRDPNLVDRSRVDLEADPRVRPLFVDRRAEGIRYFRATGILPVNHTVVVRREIAERHPWVVLNLYDMFVEAKRAFISQVRTSVEPWKGLGLLQGSDSALDVDPRPYGLIEQSMVLETLAKYSHEQGLTSRLISLDEVFAPCTLEL
jgi:4,5-dihydroxyphthalate decarboxylase